ncbi:MAG TPA: pyridoxamine 5'-phosphate oxidase family protein [Dehalococcoidia bacterium]|nr:pyridoxamine 5'-phosphate oxidase family protein [Dehalococcoidia bacterium]
MTEEQGEIYWENLNLFRLTEEESWEVIAEASGATVAWNRTDGHPIGVWVSHVIMDDDLYITTTKNRAKTRELATDPRISITCDAGGKGSVTILGTIELIDDRAMTTRFLETLADKGSMPPGEGRDFWMKRMNSAGRVVGKITPNKFITFDPRKLR